MLTLKLVEDFPVNGRVLDSKGKPVAGAKIRVLHIDSDSEENVTRSLGGLDTSDDLRRRWRGPFPERPAEVTSDGDGWFRLTGLGRDRIVELVQDEPASPEGPFLVAARPTTAARRSMYRGANFDVTATESRLIRGVCRDRATGEPLDRIRISVVRSNSKPRFTDANGRFEISVVAGLQAAVCVVAEPDGDQPYFVASALVPQTAGSEPITMDFDLVRGIPVAGTVEAPPGKKPPRSGRVDYFPLTGNAHTAKIQTWHYRPASSGLIQPDGSYRLVVFPGPGAVAVAASPKREFAAAMVDNRELERIFRDGQPHQGEQGIFTKVGPRFGQVSPALYKAVSLIDPEEKTQAMVLGIGLQASVRLRGGLYDRDGQPVTGVRVMSGLTRGWRKSEIIDWSSFEILEMSPHEVRDVIFLHREKKLGKVLTVHGNQTEPLEVRLDPCGTISGRLVDKNGQPVPNKYLRSLCDSVISTDQTGRFAEVLVPRARYSLGRLFQCETATLLDEIVLNPGQIRDLGDVSRDVGQRRPAN
jgi:hypothetical protein